MLLPEQNWQEPVRELMTLARMVVIALGPGAAPMWQVRETLRLLPPQRLTLLVPAGAGDYEPFRSATLRTRGGPVRLPPHPGAGRPGTAVPAVIFFDPDWRPALGVLGRSPMRPSALRLQLRPVLTALTRYEQRPTG